MLSTGERILIDGPVGHVEIVIDQPKIPVVRGIVLVAHPHPLFGGTLDNKVAQTLAKTMTGLGYIAIRPNFRGVGGTEGAHAEGHGEADDLVAVSHYARDRFGELPSILAGFSFGAFVQTLVAEYVPPKRMILIGTSISRGVAATVPGNSIVIHGELDETVPLKNVLDWAQPQDLPVTVVAGADHFFHRRLHIIKNIIVNSWCES